MKKPKIIFTILGVLGLLTTAVGLFLPFTNYTTFGGATVPATLFESFGIFCLIFLIATILLGYFKRYIFILIPIAGLLILGGIALYQNFSITYDPFSDYQKIEIGIGFIILCIGLILLFIYTFTDYKERRIERKKRDRSIVQEQLLQTISPFKRHDLSTTQTAITSGDYPSEISSSEIPTEKNVIKLPAEEQKEKMALTQTFDIVKETAASLENNHKEAETLTETKEDDAWDIGVNELNEILTTSPVQTTAPQVQITQPTTQTTTLQVQTATQPTTQIAASQAETTQPATQTAVPQAEATQPTTQTAASQVQATQPVTQTATPQVEATQPVIQTATPQVQATQPVIQTATPQVQTAAQPTTQTAASDIFDIIEEP